MSLAQNCFWTQPKPLDPRTRYKKLKSTVKQDNLKSVTPKC